MPFSPLGRGFLTGAVNDPENLDKNDMRRHFPRFQGENFRRNLALIQSLQQAARSKGCLASQLALAWLLAKGEDIVPIPGTKRRSYLEENAAAVQMKLSVEETAMLDEAFPSGAAAGDRYSPELMRWIDTGQSAEC